MTQEDLQKYFAEQCSVSAENIIKLGYQQLDRNDYLTVKKVLESRSGKWKGGSVQGFVFANNNAKEILASLSAGNTENVKKKFQLYETPDELADKLVQNVGNISSTLYVLEPSAGNGQLIKAIHRVCPHVVIDAYEINPDCWKTLENMDCVVSHKTDFLESSDDDKYAIIVANPPFTKNQDIKHFRKMWRVLAIGGKMSVIMSRHWMFASDKESEEFRDFIYNIGANTEEISDGAFRASGTDVPTVIVSVEKDEFNCEY